MTSDSRNSTDPTLDEPTGVPGGSYGVDEEFVEDHESEQALEEGEKPVPGL